MSISSYQLIFLLEKQNINNVIRKEILMFVFSPTILKHKRNRVKIKQYNYSTGNRNLIAKRKIADAPLVS